MATAMTVYKAADGSRWDTEEKAIERERLLAAVAHAMAPLGETPNLPGCRFENGGGFLQHEPEAVRSVRLALWELTRKPLGWWIKGQIENHGRTEEQLATECHPSWFGRMLDGSCPPLERAWGRIMCIDDRCREWGQPYYASHPEEAKQVRLN